MEDGEGLQYFQQRSSMMVNIVRRMKQELVGGGLGEGQGLGGGPREEQGLEQEFTMLWNDTWGRGRLDILGTRQAARLLQVQIPRFMLGLLLFTLG